MYAVGMLGSYLTQGVYAVAGPFQPFGGAVDIIVVQQEDGTFKSSPWYVKFGDFQGVLQRRGKIVDIAVNDVPADFHMFLDYKGEAYFEKEVEPDEGLCLALPDAPPSAGDHKGEGAMQRLADAETMVNASSHSQEEMSSEIEFTLPEQNGAVNEKSTAEEERLEMQMQSNVGLKEATLSNEADLETPETFDSGFGLEALHIQKEYPDKEEVVTSNSLTTIVENDLNSKEAALSNLDLVETAGSNTVATKDNIQSSTILTVEEGPCLQAAPLSGSEVVDGLNNDSKGDVECNRFLVDVCTEEDIDTDDNYENGFVSLGDDEALGSFKCQTVDRGNETHMYSSEDGIDIDMLDGIGIKEVSKDPQVWDSVSPLNEDSGNVTLAISQDTTFLLEEKHGGIDDAAPEKKMRCEVTEDNSIDDGTSQAMLTSVSPPSRWMSWPFSFKRSRIEKEPLPTTSSVSEQTLLAAANVAIGSPYTDEILQKKGYCKWQQKTKVRTYVPTSAQLAPLNLKDGPNKVTFTFSTVLGKTEVDARIYLWKWNTRIVISDVDGTITKSDVLGQVMPLVGRDWSQYGVTRLFSAIKDNGFEVLFLSARAISQAYLTRRFLLNLKQDGEALPEGPVFISPDGLFPSLYREVIRRAPHEFKISCLEGIRELFPKDVNPFYAGFGNRETDEISYLKVGIPKGKIFIINPKGEVVVNHRVDCKSYTSIYTLVDKMFPPMSSQEQEDFNAWNFWKIPLPDIDDEELSTKGFKSLKRVVTSKQ